MVDGVDRHGDVVEALRRDGVAVLPAAADMDRIARVRGELEAHLDNGTALNRAADDAVRAPGDLSPPRTFLSDAELANGQTAVRGRTNFLAVHDPFLNCPSTVDLAFGDALLDVATAYLECPPAVGGGNLRKSFVNDLPDFDTLHFHSDPNSSRFLKFFFYLHDVDEGGGPFCYVVGSHREKFRGWRRKYRWTPREIEARYGRDRITYVTAAAGDIVVADTTGFHRGTKVRTADRSMLTVDFVVHPEFGGRDETMHISAEAVARLDARGRAAADLLEQV
jgi:ectoine hydroxylase-related dioxygenase (phytanoyl-CoA dioxygenase family)